MEDCIFVSFFNEPGVLICSGTIFIPSSGNDPCQVFSNAVMLGESSGLVLGPPVFTLDFEDGEFTGETFTLVTDTALGDGEWQTTKGYAEVGRESVYIEGTNQPENLLMDLNSDLGGTQDLFTERTLVKDQPYLLELDYFGPVPDISHLWVDWEDQNVFHINTTGWIRVRVVLFPRGPGPKYKLRFEGPSDQPVGALIDNIRLSPLPPSSPAGTWSIAATAGDNVGAFTDCTAEPGTLTSSAKAPLPDIVVVAVALGESSGLTLGDTPVFTLDFETGPVIYVTTWGLFADWGLGDGEWDTAKDFAEVGRESVYIDGTSDPNNIVIALNSNPGGTQDLFTERTLVKDQPYLLELDYCGSVPDIGHLWVDWEDQNVAHYNHNEWIRSSLVLVPRGTGPKYKLRFEAPSDQAVGPILDNIILTPYIPSSSAGTWSIAATAGDNVGAFTDCFAEPGTLTGSGVIQRTVSATLTAEPGRVAGDLFVYHDVTSDTGLDAEPATLMGSGTIRHADIVVVAVALGESSGLALGDTPLFNIDFEGETNSNANAILPVSVLENGEWHNSKGYLEIGKEWIYVPGSINPSNYILELNTDANGINDLFTERTLVKDQPYLLELDYFARLKSSKLWMEWEDQPLATYLKSRWTKITIPLVPRGAGPDYKLRFVGPVGSSLGPILDNLTLTPYIPSSSAGTWSTAATVYSRVALDTGLDAEPGRVAGDLFVYHDVALDTGLDAEPGRVAGDLFVYHDVALDTGLDAVPATLTGSGVIQRTVNAPLTAETGRVAGDLFVYHDVASDTGLDAEPATLMGSGTIRHADIVVVAVALGESSGLALGDTPVFTLDFETGHTSNVTGWIFYDDYKLGDGEWKTTKGYAEVGRESFYVPGSINPDNFIFELNTDWGGTQDFFTERTLVKDQPYLLELDYRARRRSSKLWMEWEDQPLATYLKSRWTKISIPLVPRGAGPDYKLRFVGPVGLNSGPLLDNLTLTPYIPSSSAGTWSTAATIYSRVALDTGLDAEPGRVAGDLFVYHDVTSDTGLDAEPGLVTGDLFVYHDVASDTGLDAVPATLTGSGVIQRTVNAPLTAETGLVTGDLFVYHDVTSDTGLDAVPATLTGSGVIQRTVSATLVAESGTLVGDLFVYHDVTSDTGLDAVPATLTGSGVIQRTVSATLTAENGLVTGDLFVYHDVTSDTGLDAVPAILNGSGVIQRTVNATLTAENGLVTGDLFVYHDVSLDTGLDAVPAMLDGSGIIQRTVSALLMAENGLLESRAVASLSARYRRMAHIGFNFPL
ncbi:MAG: hypothetical protein LPH21_14775 [Shewanella sp.]|nr:hypothetical protein [Shewanella sp.]